MDTEEMSGAFQNEKYAQNYVAFRPTYPDDMYNAIYDYLGQGSCPPHELAVDVGCGSGQITRHISSHFSKVIGVDSSAAQITEAIAQNDKDNVEYRSGVMNALPAANNSVDLLITGQAAHWFDPIEEFYAESERVLKISGVLAIVTYGRAVLKHQSDCIGKLNEFLLDKFYNNAVLEPYYLTGNRICMARYQDMKLPYHGWERISDQFMIKQKMSLNDLCKYLMTLSYYWRYKQHNPAGVDPVEEFRTGCLTEMEKGESTMDDYLDIEFPITLLIGRKS